MFYKLKQDYNYSNIIKFGWYISNIMIVHLCSFFIVFIFNKINVLLPCIIFLDLKFMFIFSNATLQVDLSDRL